MMTPRKWIKRNRVALGFALSIGLLAACQAIPTQNNIPNSALPFSEHEGRQSEASKNGNQPNSIFFRNAIIHRQNEVAIIDSALKILNHLPSPTEVFTHSGPSCPSGSCNSIPKGYQNGPASNARFRGPWGMSIDIAGNLIVADGGNHVIRKVAPDGSASTLAGLYQTDTSGSPVAGYVDGSAAVAKFNTPQGTAIDASGNVYVADTLNHRIRKITPDGTVSTYAGSGPVGWGAGGFQDGSVLNAKFNHPLGVQFDYAGNLIVADGSNRVRKISPEGYVTTIAGSGEAGGADGFGTNATFNAPYDVAVDRSGTIYVVDYMGFRVRKIAPDGWVTTIAGSGIQGGADGPGAAAQFGYIGGIDIDANGNLYIADESNFKIRKVNPFGLVTTFAGSGIAGFNDGPGAIAQFTSPEGVTTDGNGKLFISQFDGNIRMATISEGCGTTQPKLITTSEPAISPNLPLGDGSKDSTALNISAGGEEWILHLHGYGEIERDFVATKAVTWKGEFAGAPLPDGKYTICLLTPTKEDHVEVIVDRVAPKINSTKIPKITSTLIDSSQPVQFSNSNTRFEFEIDAEDVKAEGIEESGIQPTSPKIMSPALEPVGEPTQVTQKKFKLIAKATNENINPLEFDSVIEDKAGNKVQIHTTKNFELRKKSGDYTSVPLSYSLQNVAPDYRRKLLDMETDGVTFDPTRHTFYAKSGMSFRYESEWTFFDVDDPMAFTTYNTQAIFKNTTNGVAYYVSHPIEFQNGVPVHVDCHWTSPETAAIGRYDIEQVNPKFERLAPASAPQFKVSDMPCIKLGDYLGDLLVGYVLPIDRTAHILDAHVLSPPNLRVEPPYNNEVRTPRDLFGSYDPSMSASRPQFPVDYNYMPQYTYANEAQHSDFSKTVFLRDVREDSKNAYETVLRMSRAIMSFEPVDPRSLETKEGDSSVAMPIVFPTVGRVFWVGVVENPPGTGGIKTAYPAYIKQDSHEAGI